MLPALRTPPTASFRISFFGCAPPIILEATNEKTLVFIVMEDLIAHAYQPL